MAKPSNPKLLYIAVAVVIIIVVASLVVWYGFMPKETTPAYPTRTIKHIMPWGAGGGTDVVMRGFMNYTQKRLPQGVTIYTVNIAGASSGLGVLELMNSPPDGYTVGTLTWDSIVTVPYFKLVEGYNLSKLRFICTVTEHPTILIVRSDARWKNITELLKDAKGRPGEIKVGNVGMGGVWHIPVACLELKAGVRFKHIAYPGGAAELREALLKGEIDVASISTSGAWPALKAGQVRVLLTFGASRSEVAPDVPTAKELGYECVFGSMRVLAMPKNAPENIAKYWENLCKETAYDSAWREWINGREPGGWIFRDSRETADYLANAQKEAFKILDELKAQGLLG
ncbi:MAG: tripartite tricarboxylate transporter substrate binding protein [Zestosphaera sp.]